MQKRDRIMLWICAAIGAIGMFSFMWAMYEMPQLDTYFGMLMMILSMLLMTISFALLDDATKNKAN